MNLKFHFLLRDGAITAFRHRLLNGEASLSYALARYSDASKSQLNAKLIVNSIPPAEKIKNETSTLNYSNNENSV